MCTIVIGVGLPGSPGLYVISNRDERLDRPATPPRIRRRDAMRMLAPRDSVGGGTWIGLNEAGVFAGITNRFGMESGAHHRSRGLVVLEVLTHETGASAIEWVRRESPRHYNGFHLVVADGHRGWVVCNDGRRLQVEELSPGFHVFSERSFGAAPSARLERMRRHLTTVDELSAPVRRKLRGWMTHHDEDQPLESTCVHLLGHDYGTRSSTIVEVDTTWRFAHAAGPPCSTAYREFSSEVDELRGTSG